MVDIETLGTTPGSVILEIAAATFSPSDGHIYEEFHTHISVLDSLAQGLVADSDTAAWHRRRSTRLPDGPTLWSALCRFSLWMPKGGTVWAWGMDFERPILEAAYHRIHAPVPWPYYRGACARTAWNLAFPVERLPSRTHSAAQDVRDQIRDLTRARQHLIIV